MQSLYYPAIHLLTGFRWTWCYLSEKKWLTHELNAIFERCADISQFDSIFIRTQITQVTGRNISENPFEKPNMPEIVTVMRFPEVEPHSWDKFVQANCCVSPSVKCRQGWLWARAYRPTAVIRRNSLDSQSSEEGDIMWPVETCW